MAKKDYYQPFIGIMLLLFLPLWYGLVFMYHEFNWDRYVSHFYAKLIWGFLAVAYLFAVEFIGNKKRKWYRTCKKDSSK